MSNEIMMPILHEVKEILNTARAEIAQEVNTKLLMSYWKIGEIIVRYEQNDNLRAKYGNQTLKQLSKELTAEFGRGFSVSNLQFMRRYHIEYQI